MIDNIPIIILAAGGSSRFGSAKLLERLPNGKTLIRHTLEITLTTSLRPNIVVLGNKQEKVWSEIKDLNCMPVVNLEWQKGLSSTLKAGIEALPETSRACVIVLSDQPFQTAELIELLLKEYLETGKQVIYPVAAGQRSNPVLLDRSTFHHLLTLEGDIGARSLFARFSTHRVIWPDERLLIDIDTEEDLKYAQSIMKATNSSQT